MYDITRRDFVKLLGLSAAYISLPEYLKASVSGGDQKLKNNNHSHLPFLFGAQYYRAPTPEPTLWEKDLGRMKELGFNCVKFWVQWRWTNRKDSEYYFDDLDRLMDLAHKNNLSVTLNIIFDNSPVWLFDKHPDAKQIMNNGRIIEPFVYASRQIGGHPGPCYNHDGAKQERKKFLIETIKHFKDHPAMGMWDIWNEPELSNPQRKGNHLDKLVCYCKNCEEGFKNWLKIKYRSIDQLNLIWGRCYNNWDEVELPRSTSAFIDFIDWREFHIDTLSNEAKWRIHLAKSIDKNHPVYLHVVPNKSSNWNAVLTSQDDFELAEDCDVFAATINEEPQNTYQVTSAGRGKICYNVESHINYGATTYHQRVLSDKELLKNFLPQIGLGIKGFMFWQFRPEVLGFESPAWGLVKPNGKDRPITKAAKRFWEKLKPYSEDLMNCFPDDPKIGIWKSRKNEVFNYCLDRRLSGYRASINNYIENLYWNNYSLRIISEDMLSHGKLDGLKLLIMPACYYLTQEEADELEKWVNGGGVLLSEAHLAGYNGSTGRHSRTVPGCGLAEKFGIEELDSTSSYNLKIKDADVFKGDLPEDVKKSLDEFGSSGGEYFPIKMNNSIIWGANRYAVLKGNDIKQEGYFNENESCIISKSYGKGYIYYAGTNLGQGALKDNTGFTKFLYDITNSAKIKPTLQSDGDVHVDYLYNGSVLKFIMIWNKSDKEKKLNLPVSGLYEEIFSGKKYKIKNGSELIIPANSAELYVKK